MEIMESFETAFQVADHTAAFSDPSHQEKEAWVRSCALEGPD